MKVICFIIHGIGVQQPNFSLPFRQSLDKRLLKLIAEESKKQPDLWANITQPSHVVEYQELFWAHVSTGEQEELYRRMYPELFMKGAVIRGMSIRLIGDVFSYLGKRQEEIKRTVFSGFIKKLKEKCDAKEPFSVVIVGHSLGSVILYEIITGLLKYRYAELAELLPATSVFTMGSPLSLFSLVTETVDPAKFRLWENFLHPRDPIAFPMHEISQSVKDIKVSSITLNPLSAHTHYWNDSTVCSRITQEIVCHVSAKAAINPSKLRLPKEIPPEVLQPSHGPALTAGFSDYQVDFGKIPFDELIEGATKIDICNVYGSAWYKKNAQYFMLAFQRQHVEVRVCMLSPTSPALPGFCHQFSRMSEADLKGNIEASKKAIRQAFQDATKQSSKPMGRLKVYLSQNIINHGFYRFDDLVYFTPRPMSSPKNAATPIPSIVFRKGLKDGDYVSWIMKDFNVLLETQGDTLLDFDSQTAQPAAPTP